MTTNTQANNTNATVTDVTPKGERGVFGRAWDATPTAVKWVAGAAVVGGVGYLAYKHFTKGNVDAVTTAANVLAGTAPALLEGAEALPAVSAAAAEALTAFA